MQKYRRIKVIVPLFRKEKIYTPPSYGDINPKIKVIALFFFFPINQSKYSKLDERGGN